MDKRLLVVSPHPDDETLGAGGTILRYKQHNHAVDWLNFTDMKEDYGYAPEIVKVRTEEIEAVRDFYGFDGFYNLGLKPAGLDEYPRAHLIRQASAILDEV